MFFLLIVSILWAFSFGLIKGNLTGLDSNLVALARLLISMLIFLPFLRLRGLSPAIMAKLTVTGTVQYGLMYASYIYAFQFLQAYEVAIFTIFTPVYVTLLNDAFQRRLAPANLLTALLAVIASGIIVYRHAVSGPLVLGFAIVQLSNLCFAFGQIYYRRVMETAGDRSDISVFALLYIGAVLATAALTAVTAEFGELELGSTQVLTLLYLGVIASGLCFFLWNAGARRVRSGTLAIFNNVKVPLAVAASLIFFGESVDSIRLAAGTLLMTAAFWADARFQGGRPAVGS